MDIKINFVFQTRNLLSLFFVVIQIVVPGTSNLRDALGEISDLLEGDIELYGLEEGSSKNALSLTSPSIDFVGKELQVVKASDGPTIEEKSKYHCFCMVQF